MKKIQVIILLVLCIFVLAGCKSIDNGTVIDKSYSPAHRSYQPMVMIVNKHTRIIPRWINHPDVWSILVENEDGRDWWNVSEDFYNSVEIGDKVDRRKDGATVNSPASLANHQALSGCTMNEAVLPSPCILPGA